MVSRRRRDERDRVLRKISRWAEVYYTSAGNLASRQPCERKEFPRGLSRRQTFLRVLREIIENRYCGALFFIERLLYLLNHLCKLIVGLYQIPVRAELQNASHVFHLAEI